MTRDEAIKQIDETQNYYVNKLKNLIENNNESYMKTYSFQSDTGTGKTKMMAKLIKLMPDYFFLVTSLSKANLAEQIKENLDKDLKNLGITNYLVYGTASYKKGTKLQAKDIIDKLPINKKCIWLRDEGHIATQNFTKLLENRVFKIIDVSATPNIDSGIKCNFTNTMMLRSVEQHIGTPEDAIKKLIEVKKQHKDVPNYNPCAIFRCVKTRSSKEDVEEDEDIVNQVKELCNKYKLKYQHIKNGKEVKSLCVDDNEIDVIINKFIITEGIDIRRAHVLYMDNQPGNINTTIQAIGRCRRNALLYNKDSNDDYLGTGIDILDESNEKLLEYTRICYVYYNVKNMELETDKNGSLCQSLCNKISCQRLKPEQIDVKNGQLPNGLFVEELENKTGEFNVSIDLDFLNLYGLEFNIVDNKDFYEDQQRSSPFSKVIYECQSGIVYLIDLYNLDKKAIGKDSIWDYGIGKYKELDRLIYKLYLLDTKYSDRFINNYNIKKYLYPELKEKYPEIYKIKQKMIYTYQKLGRAFDINNKAYLDSILRFKPYNYIFNDRELAIVGCEYFRLTKEGEWIPSKSMASKVNISSKFGQFITAKYIDELKYYIENKSLYKKNTIIDEEKDNYKFKDLDTRCNSCLGYCVEYYSKYLIYGESFLREGPFDYIYEAQTESHNYNINDGIIIRACMLKYKYFMQATFGGKVDTVIKTISIEKLIQEKYSIFIDKVKLYGNRVADFINTNINNIDSTIYPVLSTRYIKGLADYITEDTILEVKTTNGISEGHIRQVLAYHYLSTTRSDLHINRVIVFDAITNNGIIIPISTKNQISKI